MIKGEIKVMAAELMRKERIQNKGAANFLEMFFIQETKSLVEEVTHESKMAPFQACDEVVARLTGLMAKDLLNTGVIKVSYELLAKQIALSVMEEQMKGLLQGIGSAGITSKTTESSVLSKVYD